MTKRTRFLALLLTFVTLLTVMNIIPPVASIDAASKVELNAVIDTENSIIYSATPKVTAKVYSDKLGCTFEENDDYVVCTGTKATIDGKEYTVILMGDCSPDGKVDSTDAIAIKRHMLNINKLEGASASAVSFDRSGNVTATDYIRLKKYMLGLSALDVPQSYSIPDFTGKTKGEAFDLAEKAGLSVTIESVDTSEYESGKIFEQSIPMGNYILTSNEITLKLAEKDGEYSPLNYGIMKAMWLSQFDMNYALCTGSIQRDVEEYKAMVEKICDNFANNGFNTVIIQLRPNADSFYPSEIYTPSYYVTGSYYNDEFVYDPLKIFLEIAHSKNLSVQGWLNPFRCMTNSQISAVSEKYLLGQWYQNKELRAKYLYYNRSVTNTNYYYLNPAYEEVRQMVIDGTVELCTNYDIDGIHIDDYFYPTADAAFDAAAYAELGNGKSLSAFRKSNVNAVVKGMYDAIKEVNEGLLFGISPAGNIDNNRGYLSADVDTWGRVAGYVDYLMPQLYWGFNYSWWYARYENILSEWNKIVTNKNVKLIPGVALYKTLASQRDSADGNEWTINKDVLKRMAERAEAYGCGGICGFSYQHFFSYKTGAQITESSKEAANFFAALKAWN